VQRVYNASCVSSSAPLYQASVHLCKEDGNKEENGLIRPCHQMATAVKPLEKAPVGLYSRRRRPAVDRQCVGQRERKRRRAGCGAQIWADKVGTSYMPRTGACRP
jgi:hypothetical protein